MFVAGVLVVAATTSLEVLALGLDPGGRRGEDSVRTRPCESRLFFRQGGSYVLPLKHKGHDHSLAAAVFISRQTRQPVAAVDQFFDRQVQEVILGHTIAKIRKIGIQSDLPASLALFLLRPRTRPARPQGQLQFSTPGPTAP